MLAITLFVICAVSGFSFYRHHSGRETEGSRKISTVSYFPYLRLNKQSLETNVAGEETPLTGSELDEASESDVASFLESFDVGSQGDSEDEVQGCNYWQAELKVYMYDLSSEFHYGLIPGYEVEKGQYWPRNGSEIPEYPGGLYQQHSPEHWLTSDLLTSNMADRNTACTAFRVADWRDADVIFVPFFASLSYNRFGKASEEKRLTDLIKDQNDVLQLKLVKFLEEQPAWKASGGRDHVFVIHHPNSMQATRNRLRNSLFIVSDFGRYDSEVANIQKDVVAPYKHVIPTFDFDDSSFHTRKILLFFQGAIVRKEGGKIRHELYRLLKDKPGVRFTTGNTALDGFQSATIGMRSSKFCLNMAGDTPSSNRLFDSIVSHCVPVIISDDIELPFEDTLDYSNFCIFINSSLALKPGYVINMLRNVSEEEWTQLWNQLLLVEHHFEYQHPTRKNDAVNMVWKDIARKLPAINLAINRQRRYVPKPPGFPYHKLP